MVIICRSQTKQTFRTVSDRTHIKRKSWLPVVLIVMAQTKSIRSVLFS